MKSKYRKELIESVKSVRKDHTWNMKWRDSNYQRIKSKPERIKVEWKNKGNYEVKTRSS